MSATVATCDRDDAAESGEGERVCFFLDRAETSLTLADIDHAASDPEQEKSGSVTLIAYPERSELVELPPPRAHLRVGFAAPHPRFARRAVRAPAAPLPRHPAHPRSGLEARPVPPRCRAAARRADLSASGVSVSTPLLARSPIALA
jgi:hypothetical protein